MTDINDPLNVGARIHETNMARMAKQPEWVREYVKTLYRQIRELQDQLETGPEDSNTFVVGLYGSRPDQPLGRSPHIRFQTGGDHEYIEAVLMEDGMVHIRASTMLGIMTQSGNSAAVGPIGYGTGGLTREKTL